MFFLRTLSQELYNLAFLLVPSAPVQWWCTVDFDLPGMLIFHFKLCGTLTEQWLRQCPLKQYKQMTFCVSQGAKEKHVYSICAPKKLLKMWVLNCLHENENSRIVFKIHHICLMLVVVIRFENKVTFLSSALIFRTCLEMFFSGWRRSIHLLKLFIGRQPVIPATHDDVVIMTWWW